LAFQLTDTTPYHLSGHGPRELLDPIRAELETLERRARHFRERIPLRSEADGDALIAAAEAIATARAAIGESLRREHPEGDVSANEPTNRTRVLITGAGGHIGGDLARRLRDRYDLRLMYHRTIPDEPPVADWMQPDTSNIEELTAAMAGIEAVVHMAADPSTRAPWESVLPNNIIATYNVFEAARLAGVRRIVFASTNHVMGMYDRDHQRPIYADQPVRPDSLYGVSKAFGENLGRFWYDQHGVSVICLRIGWMLPEPKDEISRWMWLSPRDCAQVVTRAIETRLGFGVFYAISANSGRHWDLTATMEQLGYRPEDDAERFFASEDV
jgi:nucleoside-diphosphate-sugar epimerase